MTVNASRLLRHVGACCSARQRSLLELLSSSLLMLDQLLTFMLETHSCHILISWLAAVGLQFSCSQRIFSLSLNLLNIPHFIVFIDFSFISFFKSSLILYDWQTCLPVIVFIDLFALIFASYSLYCRHHDQQTNLQIDVKKLKWLHWSKICYYEQLCSSHAPVDSQVHLSDSVMNETSRRHSCDWLKRV